VLGVGGVAGHAHKFFPGEASGYYHAADLIRNFSAVTGACMLVRRSVYEELGGLDETNLAVAFNDVDFCLRARERGYLVVWTPEALLTHFESESRGFDLNPREIDYMVRRWGETLYRDPYYSPNLTLRHEDFSFDLSKPDGYRVGLVREPAADAGVELSGERVLTAGFRSTHDGLAGVAFWLGPGGELDGLELRLSLRAAGAEEEAVEASTPLATATRRGEVFVLLDEPIASSRGAFTLAVTSPGAVRGRAPVLRAAEPGVPAFRLLYQ
jgi:hypothetical protein